MIDDDGITHRQARPSGSSANTLGRIVSVTDPESNVQTYRYSAAGDLVPHRP